jgi:hypothetical protein
MSAFRPSNPRRIDRRPALLAAGLGVVAGVSCAFLVFGDRLVATGMAPLAGFTMVLGAWLAGISGGLLLRESRRRKLPFPVAAPDDRPIWIAMGLGAVVGIAAALIVVGSRRVATPMAPLAIATMVLGAGVAGVVRRAAASRPTSRRVICRLGLRRPSRKRR